MNRVASYGTGYPGHVNINDGNVLPGYEISDGTARPKRGQEIPLFGRIVALERFGLNSATTGRTDNRRY